MLRMFQFVSISYPETATFLVWVRDQDLGANLKARQKDIRIWLALETCSFYHMHHLQRTRITKLEPGFSDSGFRLAHSRWISRPLVKENVGSGNEIELVFGRRGKNNQTVYMEKPLARSPGSRYLQNDWHCIHFHPALTSQLCNFSYRRFAAIY